jgi:hypothetical protein
VLNIAEAAGKPTAGDNRKHFAIARGSALECGAALDTLRRGRAHRTRQMSPGRHRFDAHQALPLERPCPTLEITITITSKSTITWKHLPDRA